MSVKLFHYTSLRSANSICEEGFQCPERVGDVPGVSGPWFPPFRDEVWINSYADTLLEVTLDVEPGELRRFWWGRTHGGRDVGFYMIPDSFLKEHEPVCRIVPADDETSAA
jgi:hypothetical protein